MLRHPILSTLALRLPRFHSHPLRLQSHPHDLSVDDEVPRPAAPLPVVPPPPFRQALRQLPQGQHPAAVRGGRRVHHLPGGHSHPHRAEESAWDWRQDISFRSFVLYEVNGDLVGSLCGRDGQLYGYSLLYWTQATTDEKRRCIEQMRRFVEQERMSERPSSL